MIGITPCNTNLIAQCSALRNVYYGWGNALRKVGRAGEVSFTIEEESMIVGLYLGMLRRHAFVGSL